ncbi:MAG TPA: flagellar motor switch protein FliM, partial [Syntrophobacteraceae bacterium]|nr:flagellar motor switch protein FliM [Syntrophobacteraceae bacterium]
DRYARLFRTSMSASLRKVIDVTVTQTEMIKFGEFIRTLPVPTSLHILRMEPLRGHVLLVLESRLIFNLVDCFFGGTGKSNVKIEGRDFTAIEHRVIQKVVQMVLKDLEASWKPVT